MVDAQIDIFRLLKDGPEVLKEHGKVYEEICLTVFGLEVTAGLFHNIFGAFYLSSIPLGCKIW